jgi:hypothetical protein
MKLFLFVKKDCYYSKTFTRLIEKYWRHNDINYVVLDEVSDEDVPEYITKTPCILKINEETSESELFEGQIAFDWLYNIVKDLYSPSDESYNTEPKEPVLVPTKKIGKFSAIKIEETKDFDNKQDVMSLFEEASKAYEVSEA